jgi:DNA-binding transcriptional LysR family regulator
VAIDKLSGLIALKVVAEKRNFGAAALHLGVTTPAVSQAVKTLERRLGVTLLARTTRSTCLTEVGKRFLSQATPALEQLLAAMEDVRACATEPSGLLKINAPRSIFPGYLVPLVTTFKRAHPGVSVEIFFEDHQSDIFEHGFDAGIRISDILAKDVAAMKLFGPVRFVTAAAPHYLHARGRPLRPSDLAGHDCIVIRFESTGIYDRWEYAQGHKDVQVRVARSIILNDPLLMREAAVHGAGLIYTDENLIREEVEQGRLEVVLQDYAPESRGYYLYYPSRAQVQPKLRAFIDHVRAQGSL